MVLKPQVLNAFSALGLTPETPEDVARGTYKKLALAHHPDRNFGDASATQRFQEIGEAWHICQRHYDRPSLSEVPDPSTRPWHPFDSYGHNDYDDDDDEGPLDADEAAEFFRFMFEEMLFNRFSYARGQRYRKEHRGPPHGGMFTFSSISPDYSQKLQDRNNARQKKEKEEYLKRVRELEAEIAAEKREKQRVAQEQADARNRRTSALRRAFAAARAGNATELQSVVEEFDLNVAAPEGSKQKAPNGQFETLLHASAQACGDEALVFLLSRAASTSALNKEQLTPLHVAILHGNSLAARYFLERYRLKPTDAEGCHPSKAALDGRTPLQLALASGAPEMVELVLRDATVHDVTRCWEVADKHLREGVEVEKWQEIKEVLLTKNGFSPPDDVGSNAPGGSGTKSKKAQQKAARAKAAEEKKAKMRAEENARADRRHAEQEAQRARQAEEAARRGIKEEEKRVAEESRQLAEEEAWRAMEEDQRLAEEEAQRKADEELAEQEAQRREQEARRRAEEAQRRAAVARWEAETRRVAEEEARQAAEKEARRQAREARRAVEEAQREAARLEAEAEQERRRQEEAVAMRRVEEERARADAEREAERVRQEEENAAKSRQEAIMRRRAEQSARDKARNQRMREEKELARLKALESTDNIHKPKLNGTSDRGQSGAAANAYRRKSRAYSTTPSESDSVRSRPTPVSLENIHFKIVSPTLGAWSPPPSFVDLDVQTCTIPDDLFARGPVTLQPAPASPVVLDAGTQRGRGRGGRPYWRGRGRGRGRGQDGEIRTVPSESGTGSDSSSTNPGSGRGRGGGRSRGEYRGGKRRFFRGHDQYQKHAVGSELRSAASS